MKRGDQKRLINIQQIYFLGVISVTLANLFIFIFLLRHASFLKYKKQINFFHIVSQRVSIQNNIIYPPTSAMGDNPPPNIRLQDVQNAPRLSQPYSLIPENYTRHVRWTRWNSKIPIIYVITPTYERALQKAELARLSQTFRQIRNIHWIVVEDSEKKTPLVANFLKRSHMKYTHLAKRTRPQWRLKSTDVARKIPIVVDQRNYGLEWLRRNVNPERTRGVVYFADDDNTYDVRIFEQMRWTKEVSVWPVGFVGGARWAGPVCENGKVVKFHTKWHRNDAFPMDNAGFAINIDVLLAKKRNVNFLPIRERVQSKFLEKLTALDKLEGLAEDCTKIHVWSTQTEVPLANIAYEAELRKQGTATNFPDLEV